MTKLRTMLATFACATALALSTATTAAAAASFSELAGITTEIKQVELPAPPAYMPPSTLATPRPAQPAPFVIHKRLDMSTPLIQQAKPSAPAAKLNSIKAK